MMTTHPNMMLGEISMLQLNNKPFVNHRVHMVVRTISGIQKRSQILVHVRSQKKEIGTSASAT